MTREELMLLVRASYPGDSMKECIDEEGYVNPYPEYVGDGLATFVANEVEGAYEEDTVAALDIAIERLTNAVNDLDAVREALENERDNPTMSQLEAAAIDAMEKRRFWMNSVNEAFTIAQLSDLRSKWNSPGGRILRGQEVQKDGA